MYETNHRVLTAVDYVIMSVPNFKEHNDVVLALLKIPEAAADLCLNSVDAVILDNPSEFNDDREI